MCLRSFILSFFYLCNGFLPAQLTTVSDWATVNYNLSLASKQKQKESGLQVIPNPGNGVYTVIYKNENTGSLTLIVSDATGKYVYLKSIRDFNGELKETVDLSSHPKGLYIFEAEGTRFRELKKVVLQ